jgi:hypothetical protein
MADRFLKHKITGTVFIYAPPFVGHEDFYEVFNAAGDPMPEPEVIVNPAPKARRSKKADATETDVPEADAAPDAPVDDEALSADASRGLAAQGL